MSLSSALLKYNSRQGSLKISKQLKPQVPHLQNSVQAKKKKITTQTHSFPSPKPQNQSAQNHAHQIHHHPPRHCPRNSRFHIRKTRFHQSKFPLPHLLAQRRAPRRLHRLLRQHQEPRQRRRPPLGILEQSHEEWFYTTPEADRASIPVQIPGTIAIDYKGY